MINLFVLLVIGLINHGSAATILRVEKFYSQDTACSGSETSWLITSSTSCTPTTCENLNGMTGRTVSCLPGTLSNDDLRAILPQGWSLVKSYSSGSCSGVPTSVVAAPTDTCSGIYTGPTFQLNCASNSMTICSASQASCDGCSTINDATKDQCTSSSFPGIQSVRHRPRITTT